MEGKKTEAPSSLVPDQEGGKAGRMGNGRRRGRNGRWKGGGGKQKWEMEERRGKRE